MARANGAFAKTGDLSCVHTVKKYQSRPVYSSGEVRMRLRPSMTMEERQRANEKNTGDYLRRILGLLSERSRKCSGGMVRLCARPGSARHGRKAGGSVLL